MTCRQKFMGGATMPSLVLLPAQRRTKPMLQPGDADYERAVGAVQDYLSNASGATQPRE